MEMHRKMEDGCAYAYGYGRLSLAMVAWLHTEDMGRVSRAYIFITPRSHARRAEAVSEAVFLHQILWGLFIRGVEPLSRPYAKSLNCAIKSKKTFSAGKKERNLSGGVLSRSSSAINSILQICHLPTPFESHTAPAVAGV